MKWWRTYREAIRDMGRSDDGFHSGRSWAVLVFVLPLGLACMALLFVSRIVDDPAQLTSAEGLRDLGGIVVMAALFVGTAAFLIWDFRSNERKQQDRQRVTTEESDSRDFD